MSNSEASTQGGKEVQKAIADWLLEVSALMAVFPWLDQLVFHSRGAFDWGITLMSLTAAVGLALIGLCFLIQSRTRRIYLACAAGLLILTTIVLILRT